MKRSLGGEEIAWRLAKNELARALAIEPASDTPEGLAIIVRRPPPHIHVGFEGRSAHVFGRKTRLDMFLGGQRELAAGCGPET